ncbi:MAG: hypothetical protein LUM44_08290 [Pyrinomonadaceae bacterium]|nr:hypothetical protein [Pyrinomonadaceae bacterium]
MIEIKVLQRKNFQEYSARLQEFENVAEYPYGDDFFKLDHGENYFAFFERLGEPLFHVALDENRVIACAAGVLRNLKIGEKETKAWYLCDLKVDKNYALHKIPAKLFRKNLFSNYLKCSRGYAVSMNPAKGKNRVVKLIERFRWIPIRYAGKLNFYSFDESEAQNFHNELEAALGKISYLSLRGKKDLIMKSTNSRLPLFHIQHGEMATSAMPEPAENGTYMICSSENSALDDLLKNRFQISATASILAHRMNPKDWNFILTSDI